MAETDPAPVLAEAHDRRLLAKVLAAQGRIPIPAILTPDSAQRVHRCLAEETLHCTATGVLSLQIAPLKFDSGKRACRCP
ncbi:MAG TPA: hypothetical protein VHZ78_14665 [Rhizomicrobium sp.]|jgi:hypothetical protein|nr:hypothetical protein [Rhizomicrobium sp.]